ncbi:MAG TPA: DUF1376 domain-containing protein [Fibrobacteria bacterium]|nr:DUF1376 domain-containing protein [Fibrobacteria bacterium]
MASLKTDTWYPKYPADYLKDTLSLTMEEDGFYNRALDQVYILRGRIPAEPSRLQLLLRASPEQWERCRWILEKFFFRDGDSYGNARADIEIAKAQHLAKIAQENGKKGGRKPGQNPPGSTRETQKEPSGVPAGNPEANPEGTREQSSSPSPSQSQEERETRARETRREPGQNPPGSGTPQASLDRAAEVLQLYPAKAPKDGRPIRFTLEAQNLLAARITRHPDYPWEEHARLEAHNPTPPDGLRWVEDMPNPAQLDRLRKATAAAPRKEYFTA